MNLFPEHLSDTSKVILVALDESSHLYAFKMLDQLGTHTPTKEQIRAYVKQTLAEGKVIPGYGHAVLRNTDPRFLHLKSFAERNIKDDYIMVLIHYEFKAFGHISCIY